MFKKILLAAVLIAILVAALPTFASQPVACDPTVDYLRQGWANQRAGNLPAALASFQCGVQVEPQNPHMFLGLGSIFCAMDEVEKAAENYQLAIDLNPQYALAWNNLGWANYRLGNYEVSMQALNTAIDIDSKLSYAYNNRGLVFQQFGQLDAAMRDFQKAIDLGMKQPWAVINLHDVGFVLNNTQVAAR